MAAERDQTSAFSMYKTSTSNSKKSEKVKEKNKNRRRLAKEKKKLSIPASNIKLGLNAALSEATLVTFSQLPKKKSNKHKKNSTEKVVKELPKAVSPTKSPVLNQIPKSDKIPSASAGKIKKAKVSPQPKKRKSTNQPTRIGVEISKKKLPERESSPVSDASEEPLLTDSTQEGRNLFEWLISPYDNKSFFATTWEKKPLHIKRGQANYYKNIISTPIIDEILRTENILFTKNIDITSYENDKRETHNPVGRALPHVVWDFYLNGCSVRMLNPQTYIPRLHLLNATLQEYFNCFVGANSYLTPPGTQGFAPHYDDIEAFILQIEGKKLWKIYTPLSKEEVLPRVSSKNFTQAEIGKPVMEVLLEAGDLLYFPRGFIHQGVTVKDEHSLHITLSCYQKQSWGDLLEKLLPQTLEVAIREEPAFRQGLPLDLGNHFGLVHSDSNTPRRIEIMDHLKILFNKLATHLTCDDSVDQVAKKFMHDALPPVLSEQERQLTVYGDGDKMTKDGIVKDRVEIQLDTKVRLLRANIIRMVSEEGVIRIYHYVENSKEYHANEPQYLEIDSEIAPGIETLITAYPQYVSVEQLECQNDTDKIQIASDLWEKGILMTEYPLDFLED